MALKCVVKHEGNRRFVERERTAAAESQDFYSLGRVEYERHLVMPPASSVFTIPRSRYARAASSFSKAERTTCRF